MKSALQRFRSIQGVNTAAAFVVVFAVFSIFTPNHVFLNPRNLTTMARLMPDLGMIVLGVGMLMISGEFDLSVSSVLPLSSFMFVQYLMMGFLPLPALLLTIPVGAVLGFINGFIVAKTKLPSFIITLSTMMFWKGFLFGISRMMPISLNKYLDPEMPFVRALTGSVGPIPAAFIWFIAIAIVLGLILKRHKFGNWVYAVGSNQEAARAMGINVDLVKIVLYMLVGVLAAFGGVIQATRLGSFSATQAVKFELLAIAAVVVGGTSLRGGIGSMWSIVLGLIIIKTIENGLILMRVPVFGIDAFIGIAVIFFVVLNEMLSRRTGN